MTSGLSSGRYGAADIIAQRAAHLYQQAGATGVSAVFSTHPMLDHHVWKALSDSQQVTPAPNSLLEGVGDVAEGPARWFERTHDADQQLTSYIDTLVRTEIDPAASSVDPSPAFQKLIVEASQLLDATIPRIWQSTQPFVTRVFDIASDGSASATFDNLGGAIILGSSSIQEIDTTEHAIVMLAESLLHEAAHSKSYRVFRAFENTSVPDSPEFIDVPWWRTASSKWEWDVDRSIVACHVYTHLAVFYTAIANDDPAYMRRLNSATFRARFLSNVLLQLDESWLDAEWRDFLGWVSQSIPELPPMNRAGQAELDRPIDSFPNYGKLIA